MVKLQQTLSVTGTNQLLLFDFPLRGSGNTALFLFEPHLYRTTTTVFSMKLNPSHITKNGDL